MLTTIINFTFIILIMHSPWNLSKPFLSHEKCNQFHCSYVKNCFTQSLKMVLTILVLATSWSKGAEVVFTESIIQIKIDSVFFFQKNSRLYDKKGWGRWNGSRCVEWSKREFVHLFRWFSFVLLLFDIQMNFLSQTVTMKNIHRSDVRQFRLMSIH